MKISSFFPLFPFAIGWVISEDIYDDATDCVNAAYMTAAAAAV